ncbi:hypothetical protein D3C85_424530 [compost metagenome]
MTSRMRQERTFASPRKQTLVAANPRSGFRPFAEFSFPVRMWVFQRLLSAQTMTQALYETLETIMEHLNTRLESPPDPGVPMSHEAVLESLQWLSAANYGAAVQLTRLRKAGVELKREDGKDLDRWIVEQVRMANLASSAQTDYSERNGLAGGG